MELFLNIILIILHLLYWRRSRVIDNSNEIRKVLIALLAPQAEQENFWFNKIKPSYNIQAIIDPFKGKNHYRFGTTLSNITKEKISNSLLGRLRSPETSHILGARKKPVYCYDNSTGNFIIKFLREALGIRIASRALNIKDSHSIRYRIDTNKTLDIEFNGIKYTMLFKSKKS